MKVIELKAAVIQIKNTEFDEKTKKQGLVLLAEEYSRQTNMPLGASKDIINTLYNKL